MVGPKIGLSLNASAMVERDAYDECTIKPKRPLRIVVLALFFFFLGGLKA